MLQMIMLMLTLLVAASPIRAFRPPSRSSPSTSRSSPTSSFSPLKSIFRFWTDPPASPVSLARKKKQDLLDLCQEFKMEQQQEAAEQEVETLSTPPSFVLLHDKIEREEQLDVLAQALEETYDPVDNSNNGHLQQQQQQPPKKKKMSYFQHPQRQQPVNEWTLVCSTGQNPMPVWSNIVKFIPGLLQQFLDPGNGNNIGNQQPVAVRHKRRLDQRQMEQVLDFPSNHQQKGTISHHHHQLAFSYAKMENSNNNNDQEEEHWYRLETLHWKEVIDGETTKLIRTMNIPKFIAPKIQVETTYLDQDLLITRTQTKHNQNSKQIQIFVPNNAPKANYHNKQERKSLHQPANLFAPMADRAKNAFLGILNETTHSAQTAAMTTQRLLQRQEHIDDSVQQLELEVAAALELAEQALADAGASEQEPETNHKEQVQQVDARSPQRLARRKEEIDDSVNELELEIAAVLQMAEQALAEADAKAAENEEEEILPKEDDAVLESDEQAQEHQTIGVSSDGSETYHETHTQHEKEIVAQGEYDGSDPMDKEAKENSTITPNKDNHVRKEQQIRSSTKQTEIVAEIVPIASMLPHEIFAKMEDLGTYSKDKRNGDEMVELHPLSSRQKDIEDSVSALEKDIADALRLAQETLAEIE